ncbi:M16 family metallopeptidase [Coxiella burnetii]|uniref:M16 family metallopeptidase n=1 Tax=Coxiella burnetii TaxID=777 RepID=UPI0022315595|nr:pitrilysin family protein [Coxiella burnetii]
MRSNRYRYRWIISLLLMMCFGFAQASAIHAYQLNNGLKLIVKEDHRAPVVFTSVWYKVGGSYEHNGVTGISHVLEHMMFRGTQKYPAGAFEKEISDVGGEQNAMTADDFTVYFERLSADQLPVAFRLEADRMHNLLLSKNDFDKEIQVVMEERRMRYDDNPTSLAYERFMAAAFVNSPYHHQAIGWMTDLQHMTVQDVRDWYHAWYVPNNAIVVVVGDVNPEQVLALAKEYFGPLESKPVPHLKPRIEIPPLGTTSVKIEVPARLPMIMMGYQTPSLTTTKEKWQPYALDVLSTLLGGSDSSRFARDLIRGKQMASQAGTDYQLYQLHSNQFVLFGIPAQAHSIAELKEAFTNEIKKLQTDPVSEEELKRVKAQVIAQNIYNQDSLMNQAMDIGGAEVIGLSWQTSQDYVKNIEAVTAQQIQQVAQLYLIPRRLTVAVLQPTGEPTQPAPVQPLPAGLH